MKGRILAVCIVWIIILSASVGIYRFIISPRKIKTEIANKENAEKEKIQATSSNVFYKNHIKFALDSFSGYCIIRSQDFSNELSSKGIGLEVIDESDYAKRLEALKNNDVQMAAFTVDALISTTAKSNSSDIPGVIVALIDETKGADACVAYSKTIQNVDSLNVPGIKFVLTKDSPSEMLARVLINNFAFKNINNNSFMYVNGAEDVYKIYRKSKEQDKLAFFLWEPFVSKILENPNTHKVIDSSKFSGYIDDVIVVNRDFLYKNHDLVKDFVECYFRSVYNNRDKMVTLVLEDSNKAGTPLSQQQAENLVAGVWWKNTQENYAHLLGRRGLQHIEGMITNITKVLLATKGISGDPAKNQPNLWYYNGVVQELESAGFHPGFSDEHVRDDADLLPLSDEDWGKLSVIGTLDVPELIFARGSDILTSQSETTLDELNEKLKTFPQYYIIVKGNASSVGNADANKILADKRAESTKKYLVDKGIKESRIRAFSGSAGTSSVQVMLGQMPY